METRWWWVRHGPTHEKAFCGWRDVPADLSDGGKIERLGAYLPARAVVVSSDLRRARQTADAIAGGRERLPDADAFREINFGEWEGKRFGEVAASHPDLSRAFWETPGDVAAPSGESWNDLAARVSAAVDRIGADLAGRDIVAVAHFGVILTQLQRANSWTAAGVIAQNIDNLSVTCLVHDGDWRCGVLNHCP